MLPTALDVEELGSVYESLLDYTPKVTILEGIYHFRLVSGSDRKTTGSYYTPPELVGQLIKSALEPVIEDKLAEVNRSASILLAGESKNLARNTTTGRDNQDKLGRENKDKDNVGSDNQENLGSDNQDKLGRDNIQLGSETLPLQEENTGNASILLANSSKKLANDSQKLPLPELKRLQEEAILSIKVCDPACGSGHFLLAAARRLGKELAKIRTGELSPTPEVLRVAIRDVIQNCIYAVDANPLAVDLCKVALWIEGFCKGFPLNFLDHRIKCGNSLVGVLDISVLDEGIPDNAFTAVTGDDKTLATQFKKRNKKEREQKEQLSLFDTVETDRSEYGEIWRELGNIPETNTNEVKRKQQQYQRSHSEENQGWWRDFSACNLWTSAFFMPLTAQNLQLLPTSEALKRLLSGVESQETGVSVGELVESANQLAQEKGFFHWCLEFPEVFAEGGFSCVLGNPPWDMIQLDPREFFAVRDENIANAKNKAERDKLIKSLKKTNSNLLQDLENAQHDADAQSKFIRESGRFPLTATGRINTYAVFSETVRKIIHKTGRLGIIVPTGIVSNDTTKAFFEDLIVSQSIDNIVSFENEEFFFPSVGNRFSFCLLTLLGNAINNSQPVFIYHCHNINQLKQDERFFELSQADIQLINPNTLTCPIFRTKQDATLSKKIYKKIPILLNERLNTNTWNISQMLMFMMNSDSHLFKKDKDGEVFPLYEGKMFYLYNHRYGTYTQEMLDSDQVNFKGIPTPTIKELQDPNFTVNPRYWIDKSEVENKLAGKWNKKWLLAFRDVTNSTNERTGIFSIIPKFGVGHKAPLILAEQTNFKLYSVLLGNFNSLVLDFILRQKIGGNSLSLFIVKQLPIIPPDWYSEEDIEYISSRVLELVYTAYDMKPFAEDMGYDGEPFIWDEQRRAIIRAELDAKYAKLYGLTRDELRYILDPADIYGADFPSETFRVLKNNEIKKYGEYRTQRLVLAAWDMMGY